MTKKTSTTSELPAWLNPEAWTGFVEMRTKTKKPMTARAEALILGKLDDMRLRGHDPNSALDQSTINCWTGVFEPKGVKPAQQSFGERDEIRRQNAAAKWTGAERRDDIIDMPTKEIRRVKGT